MEINELEIYAKRYPNIRIEQLIENIKKEKKQTLADDDKIRKENEEKWFKDLIGKYILIDFNGLSMIVFHCDKSLLRPFNNNKFECFSIGRSTKGYTLTKDERKISHLWFNCPYSNKIDNIVKTKIEIITEEKYNQITEIYNTMKPQLKEWLKK